MPSVHPITQRQQKFYEDKLRNDAHKQKFSQAPEKGLDFLITVSDESKWQAFQVRKSSKLYRGPTFGRQQNHLRKIY